MNIFMVDSDPTKAAQSLVDRHVVKMILETAQLLSTTHRVLDGAPVEVTYRIPESGKVRKKKVWVLDDDRNDVLYNATHMNHPSAVWVRQSVANYAWLVEHLFALGDEYTYRYSKRHKTIEKLGYLIQSPPFNLREYDQTKMPCAMPDEYKISDDPVLNYREYYIKGKAALHRWTKREVPDWIS